MYYESIAVVSLLFQGSLNIRVGELHSPCHSVTSPSRRETLTTISVKIVCKGLGRVPPSQGEVAAELAEGVPCWHSNHRDF